MIPINLLVLFKKQLGDVVLGHSLFVAFLLIDSNSNYELRKQ